MFLCKPRQVGTNKARFVTCSLPSTDNSYLTSSTWEQESQEKSQLFLTLGWRGWMCNWSDGFLGDYPQLGKSKSVLTSPSPLQSMATTIALPPITSPMTFQLVLWVWGCDWQLNLTPSASHLGAPLAELHWHHKGRFLSHVCLPAYVQELAIPRWVSGVWGRWVPNHHTFLMYLDLNFLGSLSSSCWIWKWRLNCLISVRWRLNDPLDTKH